jgi:hypothetical protein
MNSVCDCKDSVPQQDHLSYLYKLFSQQNCKVTSIPKPQGREQFSNPLHTNYKHESNKKLGTNHPPPSYNGQLLHYSTAKASKVTIQRSTKAGSAGFNDTLGSGGDRRAQHLCTTTKKLPKATEQLTGPRLKFCSDTTLFITQHRKGIWYTADTHTGHNSNR